MPRSFVHQMRRGLSWINVPRPVERLHQFQFWVADMNVLGHSNLAPVAMVQSTHRDQEVKLFGQRLVSLRGTGALKVSRTSKHGKAWKGAVGGPHLPKVSRL